ncbi:MAG: prepilin-type N-terminal cleavage/methylation domain-containing protein [Sedimentisphaerales bacterium]|nr:prepilin-type N-terminal cleavage/methylation domain-containing protein [Sedimentisphaerales bacterium]
MKESYRNTINGGLVPATRQAKREPSPKRSRAGFTLIELLVVIAIIALLMAILLPALSRAKEMGKRAVCMNSMKQIMVAWHAYCEENNDKIPGSYTTRCVCLSPGNIYPFDTDCTRNPIYTSHGSYPSWYEMPHQWNKDTDPAMGSKKEPHYYTRFSDGSPCVGITADVFYEKAVQQPEEDWRHSIACGTLYKYLKDYKVYACPTGDKGVRVTYAGSDGANGIHNSGGWCQEGLKPGDTFNAATSRRYRAQFKQPAHRLIYICLGRIPFCNWNFRNNSGSELANGCWTMEPPLRHGNGTNLAFADGHVEYIKWGKRAVEISKSGAYGSNCSSVPSNPCDPDLLYMARVTCGFLGPYESEPYELPPGCNWER